VERNDLSFDTAATIFEQAREVLIRKRSEEP